MNQYLNNNLKTLIIAPTKYHPKMYQALLQENNIIFNVSLLNIDTFLVNTLEENNIKYTKNDSIIDKLELSNQLKSLNHQYYNNINYLNELQKLKNEFIASNISIPNNLDLNIDFQSYDFSNIKTMYDQIIIYTYEDFMPIHHDLLNNLNTNVIAYQNNNKSEYHLHEHNNIVRMLDYVIYDLYQKDNYENILIICDDPLQQDYLTNKLDLLNIPYQLEKEQLALNAYQLKSLFNYLNSNASSYDKLNINKLIKDKDINLDNLIDLSYSDYIKELYNVLVELNIFDLKVLNQLFSQLYLIDSVSIELLNNYLFDNLQNQLTINKTIKTDALFIASSSYNSLHYQEAYLLDASFAGLTPTKSSYLLNTTQRYDINNKLIANPYYAQQVKERQERLLNCADNIYIHYALINLDNKPQSLAFFIDTLNLPLNTNKEYAHLIKDAHKTDSLLLSNQVANLDNNLVLARYKDEIRLSATSLDSFFQCPYQYFINYILKPRTFEGFSYLHTGTLNHEIMENINNYLIDNDLDYNSVNEDVLMNIIENVLQTNLDIYQEKYQLNNYDLMKVYNRTKMIMMTNLKSLQYFSSFSEFKLHAVEQNLSFPINHHKIKNAKIVGKIDLTMNYNNYYYIIDYKSSTKSFNEKNFISGISNQLIVYLSLLEKQGCNLTGAFFKPIKDNYERSNNILDTEYNKQIRLEAQMLEGILIDNPYVEQFDDSFKSGSASAISTSHYDQGRSKSNIKEIEQVVECLNTLENHCTKMLDDISDANFPILPYEDASCTYCDYSNICKVSNLTLTRKELESYE